MATAMTATATAAATTTDKVTTPKPALHVEVLLKRDAGSFIRPDLVCTEVAEWLLKHFAYLQINAEVEDYEDYHGCLSRRDAIESVRVIDFDGEESSTSWYKLEDVQLDLQAYEFRNSDIDNPAIARAPTMSDGDEEDSPQMRVTHLPSKALDGAWESLIFEDPIPSRLLRFTARMITLTKNPALNLRVLNWNRLFLLHGPPGSGKTTLCRALAQKLSIRLGRHFTKSRLLEINSQSLLSKWFGESGKFVCKIFDSIETMAVEETTLLCVLIDEVETLCGSREKAASGNECGDALRATNQLLTALDHLRHRPNIIVLCTSNLLSAIDPAFLDRVDIKQYIPNPAPRAIYNIFRTCYDELVRCNLVTSTKDDAFQESARSASSREQNAIPPTQDADVLLHPHPSSPDQKLWRLAHMCDGFSGRTLRRLPFLALAMHVRSDTCTIHEALAALEVAVLEEKAVRDRGRANGMADC